MKGIRVLPEGNYKLTDTHSKCLNVQITLHSPGAVQKRIHFFYNELLL